MYDWFCYIIENFKGLNCNTGKYIDFYAKIITEPSPLSHVCVGFFFYFPNCNFLSHSNPKISLTAPLSPCDAVVPLRDVVIPLCNAVVFLHDVVVPPCNTTVLPWDTATLAASCWTIFQRREQQVEAPLLVKMLLLHCHCLAPFFARVSNKGTFDQWLHNNYYYYHPSCY